MGNDKLVYLKPNVIFEPLVNRWYAWPYIISPGTAAMYVANHHLRLMQSFATAPQIHVEALKNPDMRGGPFVRYDTNRAGEIQALHDKTRREQAPLLEFAAAIKALNELLATEAVGSSLEPLYAKVPEVLRGYVELAYDLHHRASFRLFEALLYDSEFYRESNQQLAMSELQSDARAFALSTPRLEGDGTVTLDLPFAHALVDELAKARYKPKPRGFWLDTLAPHGVDVDRFFTEQSPAPFPSWDDESVRIRYFGHACILVQSKGVSVLFDPLLPYPQAAGAPRFGFGDLPAVVDYAVITHNHQDHVLIETLLQLRHRIGTVVVPSNSPGNLADPSLKLLFQRLGFRRVVSIGELESIEFDGGSLTALPFLGEHGDLNVCSKAAHLLKVHGKTILCAADSNNLESRVYDYTKAMAGEVDVLFLGMECRGAPMSWLYGPLLAKPIVRKHDQTRRLDGSDSRKALELVDRLKPSQAYVYAMGAEPWMGFITSIEYDADSEPIVQSNHFVAECRRRGIVSERLFGRKDLILE